MDGAAFGGVATLGAVLGIDGTEVGFGAVLAMLLAARANPLPPFAIVGCVTRISATAIASAFTVILLCCTVLIDRIHNIVENNRKVKILNFPPFL